jgi:glutamate-1-semialdehyde 2,1-aminomutase
MHDALQKEIAIYEKRTPKSAEAHARALKRIPLGVASNYRAYDPYPIFVKEGKGSKIRDLDGNEYVDHNLCFGALMAGHCHPAIVKAIEKVLNAGTTFGMRSLPGGDGALRLERDGSNHARLPHGARCHQARQNPKI